MSRNYDKSGIDRSETLRSHFNKLKICKINELSKVIGATERTVFRTLKEIDYLSSFNHAGKYYTLMSVPVFNAQGLWFHRNVGFSKYGTLRATIVVLIQEAPSGCTHEDLQAVLQLRVHDTLRDLVHSKLIGREQVNAVYVYVSPHAKVAKTQVEKRKEMSPIVSITTVEQPPDLSHVVEILLIVIHNQKVSVRQIRNILDTKDIVVS